MLRSPFVLIAPASRGLSLALTRHYLRTTTLPVFATHRSNATAEIKQRILSGMHNIDPSRLHLLHLDLTKEDTIASAAGTLASTLGAQHGSPEACIHTAFFTGGILHPERQPSGLNEQDILETFRVNVISHLLLVKHFSRFLPPTSVTKGGPNILSKWVHVSARVGSISDNRLGGWYSYRASKAALNQVIRTFDLHLKTRRTPAICVGVHPGTVKTDLSRKFWSGVQKGKLFEPDFAAERLAEVVDGLQQEHRGRIWDWAGNEVLP